MGPGDEAARGRATSLDERAIAATDGDLQAEAAAPATPSDGAGPQADLAGPQADLYAAADLAPASADGAQATAPAPAQAWAAAEAMAHTMGRRVAEWAAQFKAQLAELAAQPSALGPPGPLALGGALLAAMALSQGDSPAAPGAGDPGPTPGDPASSPAATVEGAVTLGPAISGHGLTVSAYGADGQLLAQGPLDADGHYSLSLPSGYTGAVLLVVTDADTHPDYRDEATGRPRDLGGELRSVVVIGAPGRVTGHITPLTELVVRELGLASGQGAEVFTALGDLDAAHIDTVKTQVARALGLPGVDLMRTRPEPIIDASGRVDLAPANAYGRLLAALSGLEAGEDQSTDQVLSALAGQLDTDADADAGTLSANALSDLMAGARLVAQAHPAARDLLSQVGQAMGLSAAQIDAIDTAWGTLLALADGQDNQGGGLSMPQFQALGVRGVDSDAKRDALNDVLDVQTNTAVRSRSKLQALADTVSVVLATAAGGTTEPTQAELEELGLTDLTPGRTSDLVNKIANSPDDGREVDSLAELQALVDVIAPTTSVGALSLGNDTGASASDWITRQAVQTLGASLSAPLLSDEKLLGSLDDGATWQDLSNRVSGSTLNWTDATLAGSSAVRLKVVDAAANEGPVTRQAYVLDTVAPTLVITQTNANIALDGVINADERTAGVLLSGSTEAGRNVTITTGIGSGVTVASNASTGAWSATVPAENLPTSGNVSFAVSSTDAAGNSASVTRTVSVDTTAPDLVLTQANNQIATDGVINAAERTAGVLLSGSTEAGRSVTITTGIGSGVTVASNASTGAWSATVPAENLPTSGNVSFAVSSTDAAGNSASLTRTVSVDTTAPDLVVTQADNQIATDGVITADERTAGVLLSGRTEAGRSVTITTGIGSGVTVASNASTGAWSATVPAANLPTSGNVSFAVSSTDAAGNTASLTRVAVVDSAPSTATVAGAITLGPAISGNGLTVKAYSAAGQLLAQGPLSADGSYTLSLAGGYTGAVLLCVSDSGAGPDYIDEATGQPRDLDGELRSVAVLDSSGSATAHVTPLTELVLRKLGLGSSQSEAGLTLGQISVEQIALAKTKVARALGLDGLDLMTASPAPIIDANGQIDLSRANAYGRLLAALAGMEAGEGQGTDQVLQSLMDQIDMDSGTLSADAQMDLVSGARLVAQTSPAAQALFGQVGRNVGLSEAQIDGIDSAWATLLELADGQDNDGPALSAVELQALNVRRMEAGPRLDALNNVLDVKTAAAVQSRSKLQAWADTISVVLTTAAGGTTEPTQAELEELGLTDLTPGRTSDLVNKIANSPDDGREVDSLAELQALVDVIAPTTSVGALSLGNDTGASASDWITRQAVQTLGASLSAPLLSDEKLLGSLDDGATWQDLSNRVSGSTLNWTDATLAGSSAVRLKVVDAAANDGPVTRQAYVLDATAPTLAITSDKSALKAGETAAITLTFSEDPGSTFTWDGTGGDVVVSGGTLSAIAGSGLTRTATFTPAPDVASGSASITVAAGSYTDAAGNNGRAGTTPIISIDTLAPTLAITSDVSALKAGETAAITLTFSEDPGASFSWNGTSGDLTVGGGTLSAIAGSGLTRTATFTPQANLASGSASITVAAGSYTDAAGNNGGAGTTPSIGIDTLAPTASISSDKARLKAGETGTLTLVFSEGVVDFSKDDLSVESGTLGALSAAADNPDGSVSYTIAYTPAAGIEDAAMAVSLASTYTDTAGNGGAIATANLVVDTQAPTASTQTPLDAATGIGASGDLVLTFSERVRGQGTGNILIKTVADDSTVATVHASDARITGSGASTQASIYYSGLQGGTPYYVVVNAGAFADDAGNPYAGQSLQGTAGWDFTVVDPSLGIDVVAADNWVNAAENAQLIALSGAVTGTNAAIISAYTTITATLTPSGSGEAVTVGNVSYTPATGAWTAQVPANALVGGKPYTLTVKATGGTGPVLTTTATIRVDTQAPHVLAFSADNADGTVSDADQTVTYSVTFAEAIRALNDTDLSITGGTLVDGSIALAADASSATFQVKAADDSTGNLVVNLKSAVVDAAGNPLVVPSPLSLPVDTRNPTLSATTAPSVALSTVAGNAGDSAGETITLTLTFDGPFDGLSSGINNEVFTIGGVGVDATWSGSTNTRTLTYTVQAGQNGQATLDEAALKAALRAGVRDAAGNAFVYTGDIPDIDGSPLPLIDTTAPTLIISSDVSVLKADETAAITFTFSEDPGASFAWDGSMGDVEVSNGALGAISGTGLIRTAIFTPTPDLASGSAIITVAASSYADAAGNEGGASTMPSISMDTRAPSLKIEPIAEDDVLTALEAAQGLTVTGQTSAADGQQVQVYWLEGSFTTGEVSQGRWSVNLSYDDLPEDGQHLLTARIVDANGNPFLLNTRWVTVAVTPPAVTISNITLTQFSEATDPPLTQTVEQNITATLSAPLAPDERLLLSLDNGVQWLDISTSASGTSVTHAVTLNELGVISLKVQDAVGQDGATADQTYVLDTVAPTLTLDLIAEDRFIDAEEKAIGVTLSGTTDAEDGQIVTVRWGDLIWDPTAIAGIWEATVSDGQWSVTIEADDIPAAGSYLVAAVVTDQAGNLTAANDQTVTVDPDEPDPNILELAFDPITGDDGINAMEAAGELTISGTTNANDGQQVQLYWSSIVEPNWTSAVFLGLVSGGRWSATTTFPEDIPNDGEYRLTASILDDQGNSVVWNTPTVTVDTQAPSALLQIPPTHSLGQPTDDYTAQRVLPLPDGGFMLSWLAEVPIPYPPADPPADPPVSELRIRLQRFDNPSEPVEEFYEIAEPVVGDASPQVLSLGSNGDFVVCWVGEDEVPEQEQEGAPALVQQVIFYQRFHASAAPVDALPVRIDASFGQEFDELSLTALNEDGAWAVAWHMDGGTELLVQRMGPIPPSEGVSGEEASGYGPLDDPLVIQVPGTVALLDLQWLTLPPVSQDPEDPSERQFVLVWEADTNDESTDIWPDIWTDIFWQRFDGDGQAIGADGQAIDPQPVRLPRPPEEQGDEPDDLEDVEALALGSGGNFVLVYEADDDESSLNRIFVSHVTREGQVTDTQLVETPDGQHMYARWPEAIALSDNSFVMTWVQGENGWDRQAWVQLFTVNDEGEISAAPAYRLPAPTDESSVDDLLVTPWGEGGFLLSLIIEDGLSGEYDETTEFYVTVQTFDAQGLPVDGAHRLTGDTVSSAWWLDTATLSDGSHVLSWINDFGSGQMSGETIHSWHLPPDQSFTNGVTFTADGAQAVNGVTWLGVGDTVYVTLKFDEPVIVHGHPTLQLFVGSDEFLADYDGLGESDDELVFSYTIKTGDADPDGIMLGELILADGASLTDEAGNAAVLPHTGALQINSGYRVDTQAPTAWAGLQEPVMVQLDEMMPFAGAAKLLVGEGDLVAMSLVLDDGGPSSESVFVAIDRRGHAVTGFPVGQSPQSMEAEMRMAYDAWLDTDWLDTDWLLVDPATPGQGAQSFLAMVWLDSDEDLDPDPTVTQPGSTIFLSLLPYLEPVPVVSLPAAEGQLSAPQIEILGTSGAMVMTWAAVKPNGMSDVFVLPFQAGDLSELDTLPGLLSVEGPSPAGIPSSGWSDVAVNIVRVAAMGSQGAFVVACVGADDDDDATEPDTIANDDSIYLQVFAAGGDPVGLPLRVEAPGVDDGTDGVPQVLGLSDNSFVLAWMGEKASGDMHWFVQRFEVSPPPDDLSEPTVIRYAAIELSPAVPLQEIPPWPAQLTALGNGDFVIAWVGEGQYNPGVFVQRFTNGGLEPDEAVQLRSPYGAGVSREPPRVAVLGTGSAFAVAWSDWDGNIYVQRFGPYGEMAGPADRLEMPDGMDMPPDILVSNVQIAALGNDGSYAVSWTARMDFGMEGLGPGAVFVQRFNPDGSTAAHQTLFSGDDVQVSSSEPGMAYLVNEGEVAGIASLSDILNLPTDRWNATAVFQARTSTALSTAGLMAGTYRLYTVDTAGQLSEDPSDTVITLQPAPLNLGEVGKTVGGFVVNGEVEDDNSGSSVAGAGDVNGDGLSDLLITAGGGNGGGGRTYVVFGKTGSQSVNLAGLSSGGFVINGQSGNGWDHCIATGVGDVNGDSLDDLIVRSAAGSSDDGKSYVVFGKTDSAPVNLSALAGMGFVMQGAVPAAPSVSAAGDVNGDGLADLLVGFSSEGGDAGRSYVVFGKSSSDPVVFTSLGSAGFAIHGGTSGDRSGSQVAAAGDFNGDGLSDLLIAASQANQSAGLAYVVLGKESNMPVDLSSQTSDGFLLIRGDVGLAHTDLTIAAAGDVNGDGLADVLIGAPSDYGYLSGRSYVVFGRTDASTPIDLSSLGSGGFAIEALVPGDISGWSVSAAGDLNGDGLSDLLIGAPGRGYTNEDRGHTFVIFGRSSSTAVQLSDIAAGSGGFVIAGQSNGDQSGGSVSGAGDVDGDGLADLIIGAPYASSSAGFESGSSYVIFGSAASQFSETAIDHLGGSGDNAFSDGGTAKALVGGAGNDSLTATAASVLYGGAGDDVFEIGSGMIAALQSPMSAAVDRLARIDGGSGIDMLALSGEDVLLDLTLIANPAAGVPHGGSRLSSIEVIDLTGTGNNTLRLGIADVLDLGSADLFEPTGRQQLMVKGDAGDLVRPDDLADWISDPALFPFEGENYAVWDHAHALATLYVAQAVMPPLIGGDNIIILPLLPS